MHRKSGGTLKRTDQWTIWARMRVNQTIWWWDQWHRRVERQNTVCGTQLQEKKLHSLTRKQTGNHTVSFWQQSTPWCQSTSRLTWSLYSCSDHNAYLMHLQVPEGNSFGTLHNWSQPVELHAVIGVKAGSAGGSVQSWVLSTVSYMELLAGVCPGPLGC